MNARILLLGLVLVAACSPRRVREPAILQTGARVPSADATVQTARAQGAELAEREAERRDQLTAIALATCAPELCAAIARGEVALGMTETQVMAATRTTESAWSTRAAGSAAVMTPQAQQYSPRDLVGELALVQLQDGRVASYSYREPHGVRVVLGPADATTVGRAQAMAEMLIREGDDLAARGDLQGALNRYDRADVLRPGNPELDYRIATVLDKQLRPIEAVLRYKLFLHRLELERIEAVGNAYAKLADAIAHARERIIVLERRP
jgi:tetratricopeptide (TPR) repeat protein